MRRLIAVVVLAVVLVVGLIVAYRQMNKEMEMEGGMDVFSIRRRSRLWPRTWRRLKRR
jgi:uncharacterized protein YneF (UPF0154 family)